MTQKHPFPITTHNHTRIDDYFWMRDKSNPEVIAYLQAENQYTERMMADTAGLQATLYQEMVARIQETDSSPTIAIGGYLYYSRTEAGKQYPIYCRKFGDGNEELLLDLNAMAQGYLSLGVYQISPNQRYLAYSLDEDGYEDFTLYVKDLQTGEVLPERLLKTSFTAVWGNDNQTIYYTTQDQAKRSYRLYRHLLGDDPGRDTLLFDEADETYRVYVYKTKDNGYVVLHSNSIETSEIHYLSADDPAGGLILLQPRQAGRRYHIEHRQGLFYIVTNDEAKNFRLMTAPVQSPGRENWQELLAHRETVKLDDIDLFANHLVLYERENGLKTIEVINLTTGETRPVTFPEPVYTLLTPYTGLDQNPQFDSNWLRFSYTSLTTPETAYDYEMDSQEWRLVKQKAVLGGYDPAGYTTERIFAIANDGTAVPISLVYKNGLLKAGPAPCLLYGYGSYGFSTDPAFNSNRLSLLERGFVFAIAHIRGGQEMGRYWYEQGKFLQKKNSFTDFIACANHLIEQGYTGRDRLTIMGGSAGGLLIGAVLNLAPDSFRAAIAKVPFVDVVTTMLDASIPLTAGEFEEWGNPMDKTYYDYMLSYSPYDNVTAQAYPHLLVTAGLNDPRVHYWEPAKWVAKLRDHKRDSNLLLLKTNMGAGHGGASGRYDYLKEIAFDYAFLLSRLEI